MENHHNFANGLRFGPDGWLYGRCGASCPGAVGRPGTPAADRVPLVGGIWRFSPRTGRFETLCHGTTNPWGHDWNAFGDGFFINTVNGHLWQIIPGAHYVRPHTIDPNPHVYECIDTHADHWHFDVAGGWQNSRDGRAADLGGGHAHSGVMISLGSDWPEEYRGDLFTWNFHGRRLNRERLERQGSGYVARHRPDILLAADPFFRGIDLAAGPDGAAFALDWSDTGECHEATGVHRSSGRIYRIANAATASRSSRPPHDLAAMPAADLARLVEQPSEWHVRQARLLLAERAGRGLPGTVGQLKDDLTAAHTTLRRLAAAADPVTALRAVLALHAAGGTDAAFLRGLLAHPDEHLRAWGVRLLSDDWPLDGVLGPLPATAATVDRVASEWKGLEADFLALARNDPSGLVRLALASCLQRLPVGERPLLAAALMERAEDATDHNLPLLVWYGLIPVVSAEPERAADLAIGSRWPKTQRLIARRLGSLVDRDPAAVGRIVTAVAQADAATRRNLLAGLADGLAGWRRAPKPPGWDAAVAAAAGDPEAAAIARDLSAVFGDGRALDEIRRLVLDAKADIDLRRTALEALVRQGGDIRKICLPLLGERSLNLLAAQGLAAVDDPAVVKPLVDTFHRVSSASRPAIVSILSSRPRLAAGLLAAVEAGHIPKAAVSAYDLRQIRALGDPGLDATLERLFGGVAAGSADKRRRIDDLKTAIGPDALAAADPRRGRAHYEKSCARCHKLFGAGAAIGPDLTGGNRTNLDYLLENIIDPSGVVSLDYRMSVVALADGRVVSGLVTARDDRTLTLVTPTDRLTFALADVDEVTVTPQSPMPEGLLDQMAADEIRDLIAYLMQPAQVPLP
jgi:putative heme-binding domain-containing protein